MREKSLQFLLIVFILLSLVSCDKNRVFEEYQSIPNTGWHKNSPVVFNIPVSDTLNNHNLYLNIRNSIDYKYSNLWLFVEISQPDGTAMKDTFEMSLASPSGKWLGEGFGGIKTRQVIYRRNVFFSVSGEYKISIQQGMRENVLTGINDVGFRVENTN